MYRRVGAVEKVLDLYVYAKNWQEVFHLVERHPTLTKAAYLPYAQWLAENDRYYNATDEYIPEYMHYFIHITLLTTDSQNVRRVSAQLLLPNLSNISFHAFYELYIY